EEVKAPPPSSARCCCCTRGHFKTHPPAQSPPSLMLQSPKPLPRSNGCVSPRIASPRPALRGDRFPLSNGNVDIPVPVSSAPSCPCSGLPLLLPPPPLLRL
ncbi:unnamed protein product, partial [Pylaiella littoralis]